MIVLIESHRQERATRQPEVAAPDCGARWGKAAEFGFDQSDAEAENEARGGFNTVDRGEMRNSVKIWNLSPVWRAYDVVEIQSSEDPDLTIEATVTREMLIPVGTSAQKYVGGGISYVEDPGEYGFEERTIHTFVLLRLPSPVPGAPVVSSGEEGTWPSYPLATLPPGRFTAVAPVRGPGRDEMARSRTACDARHGDPAGGHASGCHRGSRSRQRRPLGQAGGVLLVERGHEKHPGAAARHEPDARRRAASVHAGHPGLGAGRFRVRIQADGDTWIEIDRLTRLMFRYTEFLPKSSPSGLTPTLTTYFDLSFDLHPPTTDEA